MKSLVILALLGSAAFAAPAKHLPGICRLDAKNNKHVQDAQKRAGCPALQAKKK